MLESIIAARRQSWRTLEERMGYRFRDVDLLAEALVHRSYAFEQGKGVLRDNEILEFLGDAVLDLVVGNGLCRAFPAMREGELTKLRSALVNETHLAAMARAIDLGSYLLLGKGEDRSQGREKPSILSGAYEAVVGAIFKDNNYEAAAAFVERHFSPLFQAARRAAALQDAKSRLQEVLQEKFNEQPAYMVEGEEGPDHNKTFTVAVLFRNTVLATASAGSKKEAEQRAAALALDSFEQGWPEAGPAKTVP